MLFQVPKTKRLLYDTLIKYIDKLLNTPLYKSPDRVQGISGPRHCGKTTLLRQIYNHYAEIAFYKEYLDNEDYVTLYDDVIAQGKRVVLVDEICKASNIAQLKFCSDVKNLQIAEVVVIYTGSTEGVLESLSHSIGRGGVHNMGILSYLEYLCWGAHSNPQDLDSIFSSSSNDTFIQYLYSLKEGIDVDNYMTDVVRDTCISISNRAREKFLVDTDDILKVIRYLSVQQNIITPTSLPDIKRYGEINKDINAIIQKINSDFQSLKNTVKNDCIHLLLKANILCESKAFKGNLTFIFTYPWILTEYLDRVLFIDTLVPIEDIWVEALIQKHMSDIYLSSGKYRVSDGSGEVDIIYNNFASPLYAVEIKNAPYDNAFNKQRSARKVAADLGVENYVFTCSRIEDTEQKPVDYVMENHKLVLLLELFKLYDKHIGPLTIPRFSHEEPPTVQFLETAVRAYLQLTSTNPVQTDLF